MCSRTVITVTSIYLILSITLRTKSLVLSNLDIVDAEDVKLITPKIHVVNVRLPRDIYENRAKLTVIDLGDWTVELNPESNLLVEPNLRTEWINDNGVSSFERVDSCEFTSGSVIGLDDSSATLTMCDNGQQIFGYINVYGAAYFVLPVNETGEHLLYKRRDKRNSNLMVQKEWFYNLTDDTIDFDGSGEEVQIDSTQSSDTSAPNTSKVYDSILHESYWKDELLDFNTEDSGYFYDSAWIHHTAQRIQKQDSSSTPTLWLEIAIAVDHTLISFHGRKKVERYVLSIMNIVNAIYQDPSLGANIKFVITRLMMYENPKLLMIRPGDAKKSLENVNNWNKNLHLSLAPGEAVHDVAIWLTRSDIGGPSGYAPVAGACDPKRSCTLNRDEGLSSAFIIAHETAHVLGLSHDGDNKSRNFCDSEALDGSVMAPLVSATFNKFFWSECSKREYQQNVNKWSCLLNFPAGIKEIFLNSTLDTSFSMDEQCRMEFGAGYRMCRAFDIVEPCTHLWCGHNKSPLVCKTKKGPPLEGTECGFGKWCIRGYCEAITEDTVNSPITLNPQDGGWSSWSTWSVCSRLSDIGVTFRSRSCNNPEPSYGGKHCEGTTEEWKVCNGNHSLIEPLTDFRAQQCKQLPTLFHLEKNLTWLPYESENKDLKCKLICISEETKELFVTQENLIDGSLCSYENSNEICVQGRCYKVACDGGNNISVQRDRCGVCGGNNTQCVQISSAIGKKLKRDVSRIAVVPRMSREINVQIDVTMSQNNETPVAFILKNRGSKKYVITIPNSIIYSEILEGTKFSYTKTGNRHNIWAKGPVLAELIFLIYVSNTYIESGIKIKIHSEYSIHKNFLIPSKRFIWIIGGWGPCSKSCGGGRRQKTTTCWDNQNNKIVRRKFCSLLQKPTLPSTECNMFDCNFEWIIGEWEPCSATCGSEGIQSRELYCIPKFVLTNISNDINTTLIKTPWKYMVSPIKCLGIAPTTIQACNRIPCLVYWQLTEWSECSSSCGRGIRTRTATCPKNDNTTLYTCGESIPAQKRSCSGKFNGIRHLCRNRKKKSCERDVSKYCSLDALQKYCKIKGFRRNCCKSCLKT